jgi:transposase-like protein
VGQVLHGSATTTHAIRAAIQRSKASLQALSERYGINPKTVPKWRRRTSLEDRPMRPKVPRSTVLSADEETLVIEFRRLTLLPVPSDRNDPHRHLTTRPDEPETSVNVPTASLVSLSRIVNVIVVDATRPA